VKVGKYELIELECGSVDEFLLMKHLLKNVSKGLVCDCKIGNEVVVESDGRYVKIVYNVGGVSEEKYEFKVDEIMGFVYGYSENVIGVKILRSDKKEFRKGVCDGE
jgi:hypothetical protein